MDICSIVVNVDLDAANTAALDCAIGLARKFGARLIGVGADEPSVGMIGIDGGAASVEFFQMARTEIEKRLKEAEARFAASVPKDMPSEWRAFIASPTRALLSSARSADLIVTARAESQTFIGTRKVDIGELVLAAGRPVLTLSDGGAALDTDRIIIGWKDTREARRAVTDALPFLQGASDVLALTISEGDPDSERESLADLVDWLGRHKIKARSELIENPQGFVDVLESTARANKANLVVSGGYGHSRMREWLFGGMTRNLFEANTLNRLFSN